MCVYKIFCNRGPQNHKTKITTITRGPKITKQKEQQQQEGAQNHNKKTTTRGPKSRQQKGQQQQQGPKITKQKDGGIDGFPKLVDQHLLKHFGKVFQYINIFNSIESILWYLKY